MVFQKYFIFSTVAYDNAFFVKMDLYTFDCYCQLSRMEKKQALNETHRVVQYANLLFLTKNFLATTS